MAMEHDLDLDTDTPDEAAGTLADDAVPSLPSLPAEPAEQAPAAEPKKKTAAAPKRKPSPGGQAVSGQAVDDVALSRIVFKNNFARKSLSVHHLQRRLAELGYRDAYTDKDGWYGDLTMRAVAAFQADEGLAGDGIVDRATLDALFHDDPNVRVID